MDGKILRLEYRVALWQFGLLKFRNGYAIDREIRNRTKSGNI